MHADTPTDNSIPRPPSPRTFISADVHAAAPATGCVAAGAALPGPAADPPDTAGMGQASSAEAVSDGVDWRAQLARLEGAYSQATLRGYAADFASFTNYCSRVGVSALPALPETVADYISDAATRLAASTLRRHVAAIARQPLQHVAACSARTLLMNLKT